MTLIIQTINLTKRYGKLVALSGLHLNIEEGECFGYIGPNGAGKTTTIRILATLLQPTWGEAKSCGHTVGYESGEIRPLIGYVPDFFGAYGAMGVQGDLEFFGAAYHVTGQQGTRVPGGGSRVVHRAGLGAGLSRSVRGLTWREPPEGPLVSQMETAPRDFSPVAIALRQPKFRSHEIREAQVNLETPFMRLTPGAVQ